MKGGENIEIDQELCEQGSCWDGYVYVGPYEGAKGSCVKKEKLCKKTRGKGYHCIKDGKISCDKVDTVEKKQKSEDGFEKKHNEKEYSECLVTAAQRRDKGKLKLCPRGYCTAKTRFEVYPSAYANGYAVGVCMGNRKDAKGVIESDDIYMKRIEGLKQKSEKKSNPLNRWYREQWVNLCEKDPKGPGGFAVCGSGKGIENPEDYPYCRAYYKLDGTGVVTVEELKEHLNESEFEEFVSHMCQKKRSKKQGVDGKPTRVKLPEHIYNKIKNLRLEQEGGSYQTEFKIPKEVKKAAKEGIQLKQNGFEGATETGWNRGIQLSEQTNIDIQSLYEMKVWFARHGPDAKNGGTSYPGYCRWLDSNSPYDKEHNKHRGAVSWLLWGGDAAYLWLKQKKIANAISEYRPKSKVASIEDNLGC